jgi:hypothetical protein
LDKRGKAVDKIYENSYIVAQIAEVKGLESQPMEEIHMENEEEKTSFA